MKILSLCLAAAIVIAAGCQKAPGPIHVLLEPDGTIKVNGQTATEYKVLREVLKKAYQQQQDAVKNVAAPKPGTSIPPCQVTIEVSHPEKNTYEQFCRILLACGGAEFECCEIAGVPYTLPRSSSPRPGPRYAPPPKVDFLPVKINAAADLKTLESHQAELQGVVVLIDARMEAPLNLVLDAFRTLREGGAKVDFCIPYDNDSEPAPQVEIRQPDLLAFDSRGNPEIGPRLKKPHSKGPATAPASPPSDILRQFTANPTPDAPSDNSKQPTVIGGGKDAGNSDKKIGPESEKKPIPDSKKPMEKIDLKGGSTDTGAESLNKGRSFFGIPIGVAQKIIFVLDRHGAMGDVGDYVKYELKRTIGALDEKSEFHIIFYTAGPPAEMPTRRLVSANERNKQMAFEFLDGMIFQGESDPSKSLQRAFELNPEVIYLLTGGEFDKSVVDLVKRLNAEKKVKVHTIGFLYPKPETDAEKILKQIAADSGGTYKFVSEKDLAELAQP